MVERRGRRQREVYLSELNEICDFIADVVRVRSMVDRSWRVELALPETTSNIVSILHDTQGQKALRIVVYDEDEFQRALNDK